MTLESYFEALRGKRVIVLGLGVSNRPLARLLLRHGAHVLGCDRARRDALCEEILELERMGMELRLGPSYLEDLTGDVAFRTPGLHPNTPELGRLRGAGTAMTSEMEAFFRVCPCKIIAVTGSDGKTTTTTLIAEILRKAGKAVWVGGNIGAPLLPLTEQMGPADVAVVELSSFQLMDMTVSPQVAVLTNLAPNHLDVHTDMAEYVSAKENICRFQGPKDVLVYNDDNDLTRAIARRASGICRAFSRQMRPSRGVALEDGMILRDGKCVLRREDIALPGIHNVENYMAAICAVEGMVSDEDIRAVAASFTGVEHRIELVREKDGVRYYNDSIASSPSRTVAGLRSFPERIILIAGGYDKKIPYDALGPEIAAHVKTLVLTGATGPKIRQSVVKAENYDPAALQIIEVDNFYNAIRRAAAEARRGDVVMLSPASASFDHFRNFAERGSAFKKTVMEL